jgi:hypothetical protein
MMVWEDLALTCMEKDAEEGERQKTKASSLHDGSHSSGSEGNESIAADMSRRVAMREQVKRPYSAFSNMIP